MRWNRRKAEDLGLLRQAVEAWREAAPAERLSEGARGRILRQVVRPAPARSAWTPLFPPVRRLALAAAVPAIVLAVLVSYGTLTGTGPDGIAPRLLASKQGDEVVFVIANGDRTHSVSRLSRPVERQGETMVVNDGTFRDRLSSDAQLVFYRID